MKNQKKLFENISGNQFKLITESVTETIQKSDLVREGLKKVFANGGKEIPYKRLEGVGMGYIKDVTTARKCALQESQNLAPSYGYTPDDNNQKFVKEVDVSPETEKTPEEGREVQIGKEIIDIAWKLAGQHGTVPPYESFIEGLRKINVLANELIEIHTGKETKTKPLSNWDTLQLKSH